MELMKREETEAYAVFEAANIDDDMLLQFSRDDLKDLFPGVENVVLRRRLWSILERLRESSDYSDGNLKTVESYKFKPIPLSPTSDKPIQASTPSRKSSESSRSSSPAIIQIKGEEDGYVVAQHAPSFLIYTDSELKNAKHSESLSDDLRNRLVRNTLSNMRASCQSLPTPREPTFGELEDMAKALVKKYPCVGRLYDDITKEFKSIPKEERPDLTEEQKSQLHSFIYNKLKKRHSNFRPAKKPQGKVPSRSHKRKKIDLPKLSTTLDTVFESSFEDSSDTTVHEMHYIALNKEQRKGKPNNSVINTYLNAEFPSRRRHIEAMPKEERPRKILEDYPCLKDPYEIVEEVRRSLALPVSSEKDQESFMAQCVDNLLSKIDSLTYFGIEKGALQAPSNVTNDGKVINLMKGINNIFKPKSKSKSSKQLKGIEVFHVIAEGGESEIDAPRIYNAPK